MINFPLQSRNSNQINSQRDTKTPITNRSHSSKSNLTNNGKSEQMCSELETQRQTRRSGDQAAAGTGHTRQVTNSQVSETKLAERVMALQMLEED